MAKSKLKPIDPLNNPADLTEASVQGAMEDIRAYQEAPPEKVKAAQEGALAAVASVWLNPTGLVPVEDIILIKLDPVSDTVGSKGLIYAPDPHKERDQQAMTRATLIAVGGNAFEQWNEPIPKPGDRIVVKKYAGLPAKAGDIEDLYRFASDNEVVAIEK